MIIPASDIAQIAVVTESSPFEDMETLMSDPISGDLYLLTKNHEDKAASIYRFTPPAESNAGNAIIMNHVGKFNQWLGPVTTGCQGIFF